jgi:hypothetical protein
MLLYKCWREEVMVAQEHGVAVQSHCSRVSCNLCRSAEEIDGLGHYVAHLKKRPPLSPLSTPADLRGHLLHLLYVSVTAFW